ncbi:hypothetical protein E3E36_04330 [Thermococcus sp. M36]|uniref:hypothetical protein n=1 Tax=Thermococcus sp. M36 TaxID=1638261 RepID=UPI00143B80FF|nr:hypothetical protein [Thermococcus sp. M36]NJE05380.1 hypothetical protein [Thermococcus sp. M36]
MFRLNWGRILIYAGIASIAYAVSRQVGVGGLAVPALLWVVLMTGADIVESLGNTGWALLIRVAGLSAPIAMLPFPEWRVQMSLLILGAGSALVAPRLEKYQRTVRGAGIFLAMYALSGIGPLLVLGDVFLYAGASVFVAYLASELSVRGHPWAEMIERNIIGIGVLGGILGLYVSVRGSLGRSHPELVFYGEWLVMVLGVAAAGAVVYSYIVEKDPEEYLLSQWRRHESRVLEKTGSELARAREAVEDFVIRGKRGPLITFITYYGAPLFDDREDFGRLVSKIADYEGKKTSLLTPVWIRRHYERRELERRARIVEEVFGELRRLMGWER